MNKLDQLYKMTKIVADTGDIDAIKQHSPIDATTNPSLLFKAAQQTQYHDLVKSAIDYGHQGDTGEHRMQRTLDKLSVNFGVEILKTIPGRISTEVDSRLSFDTAGTVAKAEQLIGLYESEGIVRERILIKVAATWEGIKAAEHLEKTGIHCNLTLMFSLVQAVACAEAGITLISPFVGRIFDWYKKAEGVESYAAHEDPGVISVSNIYDYYKAFDYKTVVMGASFRNSGEILELAGCDLLTISPGLMEELKNTEGDVPRKLDAAQSKAKTIEAIDASEQSFRWMMNEDAMATEKLSEGIRNFTADTLKLEKYIDQLAGIKAA
ncbi:MAG: transaldolase [Ectothiorhodospiraceae bacterium]|nr:transaldolase [Ectothiorhodospiraceae bacterium]